MSDFSSIMAKQMNYFFGDNMLDDFIHKELIPLSHLKERHSNWILEIDLPLVDKNNIEITLSDEYLTVKARLTKTYCVSRGSSVTEFDNFKKVIKLPSYVDTKQVSAKFKNGILKIMIPRLVDGKKISIE